MVISESVKQKEILSEKTKKPCANLGALKRLRKNLVCTHLTLKVTKEKVFALCLEKDLSPLELHVTAGIYLKSSNPSADQARPAPSPEFERLTPRGPHCRSQRLLPLTRRAACLSSHPKSQDFVAFLEVNGLLLPSPSPTWECARTAWGYTVLCKNCFGEIFPVRTGPSGTRRGHDHDPQEASPNAARGPLRQRTRPLARPHSPLR